MNNQRILVKYPTRSRPDLFLKTLEGWSDRQDDGLEVEYLISIDKDDESMTDHVIEAAKRLSHRVVVVKGESKSKIEACNRDIKSYTTYYPNWDAVLLISDDMKCACEGWDTVIREHLEKHGRNKAFWFHDGSRQKVISTLSCMGREYYDSFGYVYHPSYKSFFPDNEYTEVAQSSGRLIKSLNIVMATHEHPQWCGGHNDDALYQHNNQYWKEDQENYNRRKHLGFPA